MFEIFFVLGWGWAIIRTLRLTVQLLRERAYNKRILAQWQMYQVAADLHNDAIRQASTDKWARTVAMATNPKWHQE